MAATSLRTGPFDELSGYFQEIQRFPIISAEEELELARRWRDRHDLDAAHKLVASHLRLVVKVAMGYRGYGLPIGELIGEGNVGMMKAVHRFDPDRGFRLATYAQWWIRASIQEYVLHSWSLVKMGTTNAQKKLFFNLGRLKRGMQVVEDRALTADQVSKIAAILDVPEADVVSMNQRLTGPDYSLNVAPDTETQSQDWLVDESVSQETDFAHREEFTKRRALLPKALEILNKRELHILSERRLRDTPVTLDALSQHYGISRERVRQIEYSAFAKLQKEMQRQVNNQRVMGGTENANTDYFEPSMSD